MSLFIDSKRVKALREDMEGGAFPSRDSIISLALALGLFLERKGEPRKGRRIQINPSDLDIWPFVQVIVHERAPEIEDMESMTRYLNPYLLGGLDEIIEKLGGREGSEMLEALPFLFPP